MNTYQLANIRVSESFTLCQFPSLPGHLSSVLSLCMSRSTFFPSLSLIFTFSSTHIHSFSFEHFRLHLFFFVFLFVYIFVSFSDCKLLLLFSTFFNPFQARAARIRIVFPLRLSSDIRVCMNILFHAR